MQKQIQQNLNNFIKACNALQNQACKLYDDCFDQKGNDSNISAEMLEQLKQNKNAYAIYKLLISLDY